MLVDYNVSIVMLPSIVLGVITGGVVNSVFPSVYLAVGLVVLLVFIITSTWRKLCLIQNKEAVSHGPLCGEKKADEAKEEPASINQAHPSEQSEANPVSVSPDVGDKGPAIESNSKENTDVVVPEKDEKRNELELIIATESTNL